MQKKTLITDLDLFIAAIAQSKVSIYDLDGSIVDYGDIIHNYSPYTVKIGDTYYFRSMFDFKVNVK